MLPANMHKLTTDEILAIANKTRASFFAGARRMRVDNDLEQALVDIYVPLAASLARQSQERGSTVVIGINGAQGSGKSTLCQLLQIILEEGFAKRVTTLSIDDIYLTSAERTVLAKDVHPLLATRGVPGTHDVALGLQLFSGLRKLQVGQKLDIPVFDKAIDDRLPTEKSRQVSGPLDLVLFEGWCVGAKPQREETLTVPVNVLEREEDPDQLWRHYVNEQLQGDYARLFAEIDCLIMLKVPGMSSVIEWRGIQERKLAQTSAQQGHKIMDTAALQRFIMHYERLTKAMLTEMPDRAELVFKLNRKHQIEGVQINTRNQK
jgi:D-glycerate 3-kinase